MHLKDVMSHPPVTCPVTGTLEAAARLMWESDCGIVPVVDADGRLAGVVTDRDICMAALMQGRPLHEIPVSTTMATDVGAGHAGDPIESAESLMAARQVRRLPVVDEASRPVGVVALNDLARLAARAHRSRLDRGLVETLAKIGAPRTRLVEPAPKARIVRATA